MRTKNNLEKKIILLQNQIKNKKISNAYIFISPDKFLANYLAKSFAAMILKVSKNKLKTEPNFYFLKKKDDKKNISIEETRALRETLSLTGRGANFKVALIENIEFFSPAAAASLLKTVEEPKGKTVIIMTANSEREVAKTIISRCQKIKIAETAKKYIKKIFQGFTQGKRDFSQELFSHPRAKSVYLTKEGKKKDLQVLIDSWKKNEELWRKIKKSSFWKREEMAKTNLCQQQEQEIFIDFMILKLANLFLREVKKRKRKKAEFLLKKIYFLLKIKNMLRLNVDSRLLIGNLLLNI